MSRTIFRGPKPSRHTTFVQRRLNVDATSWRCIDVDAMLSQHCARASWERCPSHRRSTVLTLEKIYIQNTLPSSLKRLNWDGSISSESKKHTIYLSSADFAIGMLKVILWNNAVDKGFMRNAWKEPLCNVQITIAAITLYFCTVWSGPSIYSTVSISFVREAFLMGSHNIHVCFHRDIRKNINIQLTLVISTSLISNNRLSRSENLVPA